MKDYELESKLKALPLKKLRAEFKASLLEQSKRELALSRGLLPERKPNLVPAFNSALLMLICALLASLYLSPAATYPENAALKPDAAILEVAKEFYSPSALKFWANSLKSGGTTLIPLKEVQYEDIEQQDYPGGSGYSPAFSFKLFNCQPYFS